MDCSTPGFSVLHHLPELAQIMSIESVMPSNHLILCHPLLLLPSIFPSIRVFSDESALCIRWPKNWSFSISPSNEYSGLISFRMDWLDLSKVKERTKWSLTPCQSRTQWSYQLTRNLCCSKPVPWGSLFSSRVSAERGAGEEKARPRWAAEPHPRAERTWRDHGKSGQHDAEIRRLLWRPPSGDSPSGDPHSGDPPSGDPPSGDPPLGPCRPLSEQVVRQPRTPLAESPPVTLCCRANRQRRSSLLPSKEAFEAWELGVVAGSLPLMRQ